MSGRYVWVPDPAPKPVSAAKWVPLAKKHKLTIDFDSTCVTSSTEAEPFIARFWGEDFTERDVGACVVRVTNEITKGDKS